MKIIFLFSCLDIANLIYIGTNIRIIKDFKKTIMQEYEMTNLGHMKYFLRMQVKQKLEQIFISQEKYIHDLLKKFHIKDCKPVATLMALNEKLMKQDGKEKVNEITYQSLVGSLIYLINRRPHIVHAISTVSRFISEPRKGHFSTTKKIFTICEGFEDIWHLV